VASACERFRRPLTGPNSTTTNREAYVFTADATTTRPAAAAADGDRAKFQMWLSVSSLVSFGSQILLRDAAALSVGAAVGAPDRVPLEMGVFGLFCLLNIFELALVPTTFLNLGLIEVVEDFVERQSRAKDTPYAIDAK